MKKLIFLLMSLLFCLAGFAQAKPLEYQSMYIPKSNQQIWNEVVMVNTIVDNETLEAKINYLKGRYITSINNSNTALKYSKKYLSTINTELYYILGKNYQKIGKEGKAKKYLKKARKYGIYRDSQVFPQ